MSYAAMGRGWSLAEEARCKGPETRARCLPCDTVAGRSEWLSGVSSLGSEEGRRGWGSGQARITGALTRLTPCMVATGWV